MSPIAGWVLEGVHGPTIWVGARLGRLGGRGKKTTSSTRYLNPNSFKSELGEGETS